jgi:hypothetical protein
LLAVPCEPTQDFTHITMIVSYCLGPDVGLSTIFWCQNVLQRRGVNSRRTTGLRARLARLGDRPRQHALSATRVLFATVVVWSRGRAQSRDSPMLRSYSPAGASLQQVKQTRAAARWVVVGPSLSPNAAGLTASLHVPFRRAAHATHHQAADSAESIHRTGRRLTSAPPRASLLHATYGDWLP